MNAYRVLGIDTGFAICGWAILELSAGNKKKIIDFGVVETLKESKIEDRFLEIAQGITEIIDKYNPIHLAIEEIFFFKNQKTVINVAQVRGVIIATAKGMGLKIFNYTPLQVKQALTGYGRASKSSMQEMIVRLLDLEELPNPDDVADALAIAYCHINSSKYNLNNKI